MISKYQLANANELAISDSQWLKANCQFIVHSYLLIDKGGSL